MPETLETVIALIKGGGIDFWKETSNYEVLLDIAEINLFSDVNDFNSENILG